MAGFFGLAKAQKDAGRMLTAVHAEIDATVSESGLGNARKCTIGESVKCDDGSQTPAALGDSRRYHDADSRLDLVLLRAATPEKIDPNNPPAPDLLDDARITLLVTDGMQAGEPGKAPGDNAATACAHGADPTCVSAILRDRIAEGWGVWFIGVLLPFNGYHFAERALIGTYFDEAKKHVGELKFDPRNLGVDFAINGRLGTEGKTGNSMYAYRGYKPLLIMVFSREHAMGRGFVGSLAQKLAKAPIQPGKMKREDTVHWLELAPLTSPTAKALKLDVLSTEDQKKEGIDPSALAEFHFKGSAVVEGGLSAGVVCGPNGRALTSLEYGADDSGSLPPYFKTEVKLIPVADNPVGSVAPPVDTGPGRVRTGVNCKPLKRGDTALHFTLESSVSVAASATTTEWWSRGGWSSEDNWKMPERLYGLDRLVLPVFARRSGTHTASAKIVVHVHRN